MQATHIYKATFCFALAYPQRELALDADASHRPWLHPLFDSDCPCAGNRDSHATRTSSPQAGCRLSSVHRPAHSMRPHWTAKLATQTFAMPKAQRPCLRSHAPVFTFPLNMSCSPRFDWHAIVGGGLRSMCPLSHHQEHGRAKGTGRMLSSRPPSRFLFLAEAHTTQLPHRVPAL